MTDPADKPESRCQLDLDGARVLGKRPLGSLGSVLGAERPESASAEDWCGVDRLLLRELSPQEDESEESVALLRQDALALAAVEHPNLLRVFGLVNWQGKEYVALEWPTGEELVPVLDDRDLPPRRALEAALDVASALGELCSRGRPHRDFRSSSVFIPEEGPARIVPLACPEEFHMDERASAAGSYRGHPLYAAPELHPGGGREPTERSNVFAFGVVFYEMLAFRRPFQGGTPSRLLLDVREASPSPPSSVARGCPAELDRVCLGCIEKDPERRSPDFSAVRESIEVASQTAAFGHALRPVEGAAEPGLAGAAPVKLTRPPPGPSTSERARAAAEAPADGPGRAHLRQAQCARPERVEGRADAGPSGETAPPPSPPAPAGLGAQDAVEPPPFDSLRTAALSLSKVPPPLPSVPGGGAPHHAPPSRAGMSRGQMLIVAGAAGALLVGLGLVFLLLGLGERRAASAKKLTTRVLADAEELLQKDEAEEALGLLEEHPAIRDVEPAAYDELHALAYVAHWTARASRAEWEGRWDEAARALGSVMEKTDDAGRASLERRLQKAKYRASVARAEAAERSSDWKAAEAALVEAGELAPVVDAPEDERAPLREALAFARAMRRAETSRAAGAVGAVGNDDAARLTPRPWGSSPKSERAALFEAARLRPEQREVLGRLAELGAGPEIAGKLLARAREALEAGDLDAAGRHASDAAARWPVMSGIGERPAQVLAYISDRKSCERDGMVLVTRDDPFVAWGPAERARAFGIDRYEFPNVARRLPRTGVSWEEASDLARRAGKRLCTLAEWRLACGGPEGLEYSYGNVYGMRAANTYGSGPAPSGSFEKDASPFGVHDMSGNVAEWTAETRGLPAAAGENAYVAGGDWSSGAERSKSTSSFGFARGLTSPRIGFRCCRSLAPPPGTATKATADERR